MLKIPYNNKKIKRKRKNLKIYLNKKKKEKKGIWKKINQLFF